MKVSLLLGILAGFSLGYLTINKMWIEGLLIFGILIPLLFMGIDMKYVLPSQLKGKRNK